MIKLDDKLSCPTKPKVFFSSLLLLFSKSAKVEKGAKNVSNSQMNCANTFSPLNASFNAEKGKLKTTYCVIVGTVVKRFRLLFKCETRVKTKFNSRELLRLYFLHS